MSLKRLRLSFFKANLHNMYQWLETFSCRTLEGHTHRVCCLAVLGNGVSLASGSGDGTVKVWR